MSPFQLANISFHRLATWRRYYKTRLRSDFLPGSDHSTSRFEYQKQYEDTVQGNTTNYDVIISLK
jgi:hypothetical protein